jgi:hypothetical protein
MDRNSDLVRQQAAAAANKANSSFLRNEKWIKL